MHERWNEIYQIMETWLALITAIASIGSFIVVFLGYKLAKKFLEQHLKKIQLEDFFKNRSDLYFELESLDKIVKKITFSRIHYFETKLEVPTEIEIHWYNMGPNSSVHFSAFDKDHIVEVFYRRIYNNHQLLTSSLKKIRSILTFLEDDQLINLLNQLSPKIESLISFNYHFFEDLVLTQLIEGTTYEKGSVKTREPERYNIRVDILNGYIRQLYSENFNNNTFLNELIPIIERMQKEIILYPNRLVSEKFKNQL
ncbi:hypothetical protein JYB64_12875 [Algoriphagus aestuarii]|nr:hypothetical protein [Algoriphagus aestuarii]